MSAQRSVIFEGVEYASVKAAAEHVGIKYATVSRRLRLGASVDDALSTPTAKSNYAAPREITIQGVTYKTLAAAARAHGVSKSTLRKRVLSGWKETDILDEAWVNGCPNSNRDDRTWASEGEN